MQISIQTEKVYNFKLSRNEVIDLYLVIYNNVPLTAGDIMDRLYSALKLEFGPIKGQELDHSYVAPTA